MIPLEILEALPTLVPDSEGNPMRFEPGTALGGGCINSACILNSDSGPFFIKWNRSDAYPGMFEAEERGLKLLGAQSELRIPQVIAAGSSANYSFLMLEYLGRGRQASDFWDRFAHGLAMLHRQSTDRFGLDHDNYIGSLAQRNKWQPDWSSFFYLQRLEPQASLAYDSALLGKPELNALERLAGRLDSIFPREAASLLHGDLWNGNYLLGPEGEPCLIDPAVYYGHREMDLGMSLLFGGFAPAFYDAYNQHFPLEPDWRSRVDICNLYPLLVHVNLFGGGYTAQVRSILRPFMG